MKKMYKIDQSGKIEDNKDTIIALSNEIEYTIKIPRKIKRELKQNYKHIKNLRYKLFAIAVLFAIKDHIKNEEQIIIDREYFGKNWLIKIYLLKYIKDIDKKFDKDRILFDKIENKSKVHRLAYSTFKGGKKPNRIIRKEEILELLK